MNALDKLRPVNSRSFTVQEAEDLGVSKYSLVYLAREGELQRLTSGLYAFPDYQPTGLDEVLADYLKVVPQAVVGLDSALELHGIGETMPDEITLLVPITNVTKRKIEGLRFYQVRNFASLDVQKIKGLPITSINQTLVDLLRVKRPMSQVLEVFYEARNQKDLNVSISKIKKLSKDFRIKRRLEQFLEAVS